MVQGSGDIGATVTPAGVTLDDHRRMPRLFKITGGSNPYAAQEIYVRESDGSREDYPGYVLATAMNLLWEINGDAGVAVDTVVAAYPNAAGNGFWFDKGAAGGLDVATFNTTSPLVSVPDSGPSSETGVTELWFDRQSGVRFQPNVAVPPPPGPPGPPPPPADVVTLLPAGNTQQGVVTVTEPNATSGGGFYGLVAQQLGRGNKDTYGFIATGCAHVVTTLPGSLTGVQTYHLVMAQGSTTANSRNTLDYGSVQTFSVLPGGPAVATLRRLRMIVPGPFVAGHSSGNVYGPDMGWTFEQSAASNASASNPLGNDDGYGQFTVGGQFGPWSPTGDNRRPWGSLLPPPPPFTGGSRIDQPGRVAYAVSYPAVGSRPGGIDHGRTCTVGLAYGLNQAVTLSWSGGIFTAAAVSATTVSPPPPVPPVVSPPIIPPPVFPPPPPPPPPPTIVTIIGTKGKKGGTPGFDGPPIAGATGPTAGTSPPPSTPSGSPNSVGGSPVPPLAPPGVTSPGVPAFVTDARSKDALILQDDAGNWRRVRIDGTGAVYTSSPIDFP